MEIEDFSEEEIESGTNAVIFFNKLKRNSKKKNQSEEENENQADNFSHEELQSTENRDEDSPNENDPDQKRKRRPDRRSRHVAKNLNRFLRTKKIVRSRGYHYLEEALISLGEPGTTLEICNEVKKNNKHLWQAYLDFFVDETEANRSLRIFVVENPINTMKVSEKRWGTETKRKDKQFSFMEHFYFEQSEDSERRKRIGLRRWLQDEKMRMILEVKRKERSMKTNKKNILDQSKEIDSNESESEDDQNPKVKQENPPDETDLKRKAESEIPEEDVKKPKLKVNAPKGKILTNSQRKILMQEELLYLLLTNPDRRIHLATSIIKMNLSLKDYANIICRIGDGDLETIEFLETYCLKEFK
ncbi:hypothetical protein M0811_04015 [Anaeramoeba ignava]|uniref:Uncharacterized protein n=1 Tax=Anaeramoeba ignava TaxID=1746090 RepID=A0A9Q0LVW5_ANAIG|nr:hypothetical protein M0811_04015 [Anaeramoeba ignava]